MTFHLLESLRYEPGRGFFLLEAHLARLASSSACFGFRYDRGAVRRGLGDAVEGLRGPAKVRLELESEGGLRVQQEPLGAASHAGVRLALCRSTVDSRDPLLRHKTTRRGLFEERLAAYPSADDVLMLNERGELTESTRANLVLRVGGAWYTPPLASGLLPGVFREALLRWGRIRERRLPVADLWRADGVYLINSVRRWRPVVLVE